MTLHSPYATIKVYNRRSYEYSKSDAGEGGAKKCGDEVGSDAGVGFVNAFF